MKNKEKDITMYEGERKEVKKERGTEMKKDDWAKETNVRRSYQLECAIANLRQVGWGRKRSFCNCEKEKDIEMRTSLIDQLNKHTSF